MRGATARQLRDEIEYPSSDGEPMGETDIHIEEMLALIATLKARYASQSDVYVAGNLLIYYEEGNSKARFSPDAFVVFGAPKRRRRTYKLWEEKRSPSVVIEVSSRGTSLEDEGNKKALCARLGVAEYYLFDPEAEYLSPPLQGFQLKRGMYMPLRRGADGSIRSPSLGLRLVRDGLHLRLVDSATGKRLLRPEELAAARQDAETRALLEGEARAKAEDARAKAEDACARAEDARAKAEARAAAAEAELARLRRSAPARPGRPRPARR